MKDINIKINGIDTLVKAQRYFIDDISAYLVYSKDEADTDGNVKIYVAKVLDNSQVVAINTPEEWDKVKKTIVGIINDNKECSKLDVTDLDCDVLNNIEITEVRALRLPNAVMQYLSANQPEFNTVALTENEKKLEDSAEKLKNMNSELDAMLTNFETQTSNVTKEEKIAEPIIDSNKEEVNNEEKMGATMQIIMPTKQPIVEEDHKKKKKFSFKSLFNKKEDEEVENETKDTIKNEIAPTAEINPIKVELGVPNAIDSIGPVHPIFEQPVAVVPEVISQEALSIDNEIASNITLESALPTPVELNPIVVENTMEMSPSIFSTFENTSIEPIVEAPQKEEKSDVSGFEFFDTVPIVNIEQPKEEVTTATPMEVLILEEDMKYKKMYEETEEKVTELENKIFEMEKSIEIYEAKLKEIKNITQ